MADGLVYTMDSTIDSLCEITGLNCKFAPTGLTGHKAAGNVETKIKAVKTALGGVDFRSANLNITDFYSILMIIEAQINNIPLGLRSKGKRGEKMYDTMHPQQKTGIFFFFIEDDLNEHMRRMKCVQDSLDHFISNYFTSIETSSKKAELPASVNSI